MSLVMHAADGTFFGFAMAGLGAADVEQGLLIKVVLVCAVTIGLMVFDRKSWRTSPGWHPETGRAADGHAATIAVDRREPGPSVGETGSRTSAGADT